MTRLHVDLCSGKGGWQAPFQDDPDWRSVGVDIRDDLNADVVGDVRRLPLDCSPTLITASPPCTEFSQANPHRTIDGSYQPDTSIWEACEAAVDGLNPEWWVLENIAGAKHWMGDSKWSRHPWHLWGDFPPLNTGDLRPKGETWNQDPADTAEIPHDLARAVKLSVEWSR